ncbi:hypothetical protein [Telluria beijingensis]|nr:hypothetical protein [Massilia sp. REN29]
MDQLTGTGAAGRVSGGIAAGSRVRESGSPAVMGIKLLSLFDVSQTKI